MPVSTRSQSAIRGPPDSDRHQEDDDQAVMGSSQQTHLRNPHHRLKEKMKALTLLYQQQKQASMALRNPPPPPPPPPPPTPPLAAAAAADEFSDVKENVVVAAASNCYPIVPISCPNKVSVPAEAERRTAATRRLSMAGPQKEAGVVESEDKVGSSRILVFVRLRPMARKEEEGGSRCCVRIVSRRDVYLTEFGTETDYLRLNRVRGRHFTFDASFPDYTTQREVYSTTTAELMEGVLQGRNGTVFCYGATGAGKTYTMLGTVENPGVMVLAIKDLFSKVRQRSCDGKHVVHLSYLEVYNETVRDLLSPGRPLVLREDKQGIVAAGLTQYRAYSTDEVMALLQRGNQSRTTEPTRANETSSRSHAILQVVVEYQVMDASRNVVNRVGKLSLVDLAGSERALATDLRTLRSVEGANINRSLLALSSCINALVEGKKHIPYRNSKLTQLLKDSLGGACNTVMIANISPSSLSFGETQNTLHWADRAKEIRTKAYQANEQIVKMPESEIDRVKLLLELQKENRELRVQLAQMQQKLLTVQPQSTVANSSPAPSVTSLLTSPLSAKPNGRQISKALFGGNCFSPESKRRGPPEAMVKEFQQTVKTLEAEIERMKKEHAARLKQKDDFICELSRKSMKQSQGVGGDVTKTKRVVTRGSLRPKEDSKGELKSSCHRFLSPAPTPTTKKRSFWDIIPSSSQSAATINARKTRSHVISEPAQQQVPSMLLQPGFARQKQPGAWRQ